MKLPDPAWFWGKVEKTSGCWLWRGPIQAAWNGGGTTNGGRNRRRCVGGYGMVSVKGQNPRQAHRVAWTMIRGEIPPGLFVLHACDVKLCVNPDHLYLGTQRQNIRDAISRGQIRSLLTTDQIAEARELRRSGFGFKRIASALGIDKETARRAFWGATACATTGPDDPLRQRIPAPPARMGGRPPRIGQEVSA